MENETIKQIMKYEALGDIDTLNELKSIAEATFNGDDVNGIEKAIKRIEENNNKYVDATKSTETSTEDIKHIIDLGGSNEELNKRTLSIDNEIRKIKDDTERSLEHEFISTLDKTATPDQCFVYVAQYCPTISSERVMELLATPEAQSKMSHYVSDIFERNKDDLGSLVNTIERYVGRFEKIGVNLQYLKRNSMIKNYIFDYFGSAINRIQVDGSKEEREKLYYQVNTLDRLGFGETVK